MSKLVIKENEFWIDGVRNPQRVSCIEVHHQAGTKPVAVLHCLFDEIEIDDCVISTNQIEPEQGWERE